MLLQSNELPDKPEIAEPSKFQLKPFFHKPKSLKYQNWELVYRAVDWNGVYYLEWRLFRPDGSVQKDGTLQNKKAFVNLCDEALENMLPTWVNYHTINDFSQKKQTPTETLPSSNSKPEKQKTNGKNH
jgi:hypothetical protein